MKENVLGANFQIWKQEEILVNNFQNIQIIYRKTVQENLNVR